MIVFDTNVMIAFFKGHKATVALVEDVAGRAKIGLSIITFVELYGGTEEKELKKIEGFLRDVELVPFSDKERARRAAFYRHTFKLKTPDAMIIASCEENECDFYTYDRDFKQLNVAWIHVLKYTP